MPADVRGPATAEAAAFADNCRQALVGCSALLATLVEVYKDGEALDNTEREHAMIQCGCEGCKAMLMATIGLHRNVQSHRMDFCLRI